MMKKLFTLLIAITLFTTAKAQWVTIPDTNFVNWLNNYGYSGAMNGNQMDTSSSLVTTATVINCGGYSISNLTGIQYFTSLTTLNCGVNQLTSLPTLPSTLTTLYCENNQLTSLPSLPSSLIDLYCYGNQLTSLPSLPSTLTTLACYNNQLTSLPALPSSLNTLSCNGNQLTTLPTLPSSLTILSCFSNQLTSLPALPSSLINLYCNNNQLTSLPSLPSALATMWCNSNQLICLPDLKNITYLTCFSNPLNCLPNYGWNNQLYNSFHTQYSICGLFNPTACEMYWNISGTVYIDKNSSCTYDVADTVLKNIKVELWCKGNLEQQTFSRPDGTYTFDVNTYDTFQVKIDTTHLRFYVSCSTQQVDTSIISAADSIDANMNFGMQCKTISDDIAAQNIIGTRHRPGRNVNINLQAGLKRIYGYECSNSNLNGRIKLFKSGSLKFLNNNSYSITPSTISPDSLIWNVADFNLFANNIFFIAQVDTQAQIGQSVCYELVLEHNFADANHKNDTLNLCFPIFNGYDPNEKSGRLNAADSTITYTVQFQNTGNDTAQHIIVRDTLSNDLDIKTLEILNYSFQPFIQTFGNIAIFNFPNIYLVDSATNEPKSHGFVTFKLKLKPTALSSIQNQAAIYFDFNPPIYTNNSLVSLCTYHRTYYSFTHNICIGSLYNFNGNILNQSGTYYDTMSNYLGCDSIITLQLNIIPAPDTSVIQSGNLLIAKAQHSSYYWYDCTQHQLIQNANNDTFKINHSGTYAVIVQDSSTQCSDTSNCRMMLISGVEEQLTVDGNQLTIYPNPVGSQLIVSSNQSRTYGTVNTIEITNVLGCVMLRNEASIQQINKSLTQQLQIDVSSLPQGLYFLKLTDKNGNTSIGKFVKE